MGCSQLIIAKDSCGQLHRYHEVRPSDLRENKGERTGLVVMGLDYAGLILENTDKGLVLSQVSCRKADKGTPRNSERHNRFKR